MCACRKIHISCYLFLKFLAPTGAQGVTGAQGATGAGAGAGAGGYRFSNGRKTKIELQGLSSGKFN